MKVFAAAMIAAALIATGCAENTTKPASGVSNATGKSYPAHNRKIRIVKGDLPSGVTYEPIAEVKAIKGWYGELRDAEKEIADNARAVGADAIIREKAWHAPRAFTWAAPHAEGLAIKITGNVSLDGIPGDWL